MHVHVMVNGSPVEIQLVRRGKRGRVVVGDYQIPAGDGYELRRTYDIGSQLAIELVKPIGQCEQIRTLYVDLVAQLWHAVQHLEGYSRGRRRVGRKLYS